MANRQTRRCERCREPFVTTARNPDRFCVVCRKGVKAELKAAGFLTPYPRPRKPPKNSPEYGGDPSPSGENAVRALEGD